MKVLKSIVLVLVVIVVIAVIAMAVAPKNLQISESITINKPAEVIYNQVSDFKLWQEWSPWQKADPNMIQTYSENTGLDSWVDWKSETQGDGRQTFVEAKPNTYLSSKMNFADWEGDNFANWTFEETEEGTKVTWTMDGAPMPFFFRPMVWAMAGMVEGNYKDGLAALKTVCEALPEVEKTYSGYKIEEVELESRTYLAYKDTVAFSEIGAFYGKHLPALFGACSAKKLEMTSKPTGLYFHWDPENGKTVLGAGMAVSDAGDGVEGYESYEVGGKALMISYYGAYDKSGEAHDAMAEYISEKGLTQRSPVLEEYINNPMDEPDTSKLLTHIYYLYE